MIVAQRSLVHDTARAGFERVEPDAAVEIGRASGRHIGQAVLNQHTAVDRPDRFELLHGDRSPFVRRGQEAPAQLAVAARSGSKPSRRREPNSAQSCQMVGGESTRPPAVNDHSTLPWAASSATTRCSSIELTNTFPPATTGALSLPPTCVSHAGASAAGNSAAVPPLRAASPR